MAWASVRFPLGRLPRNSLGKRGLDQPIDEWLATAMAYPGIQLLPLTLNILIEATRLPGGFRSDGWHLEAWAVFSNHDHFVGNSHEGSGTLKEFLTELRSVTATEVNRQDPQTEKASLA